MIDPSRYALLTNEFRYVIVSSPTVAATYAKAREMVIDSKFASADNLGSIANAIFAVIGVPKRRFEVVLSGTDVISPDLYATRTPTIRLVDSKFGVDGLFAVTRMVVNEAENLTVMEAWGG